MSPKRSDEPWAQELKERTRFRTRMMTLERNCNREAVRERKCAMDREMPSPGERKALCPNIDKPFNNCYCISTSSLYAEATIHYCGGNYKDCEIYVKNAEGRAEEI